MLTNVHCDPPDVVAVPPYATLIFADDWLDLCAAAGGEDKLIAMLGVKDERWPINI
jgi:hypothetical protein